MIIEFNLPEESGAYQTFVESNQSFTRVNFPDKIVVYTEGDIPEDPVPSVVSPTAIRYALNSLGYRDSFEQAVSAASCNIRDWWEFSLRLDTSSSFFTGLLAEGQLQEVFKLAAKL